MLPRMKTATAPRCLPAGLRVSHLPREALRVTFTSRQLHPHPRPLAIMALPPCPPGAESVLPQGTRRPARFGHSLGGQRKKPRPGLPLLRVSAMFILKTQGFNRVTVYARRSLLGFLIRWSESPRVSGSLLFLTKTRPSLATRPSQAPRPGPTSPGRSVKQDEAVALWLLQKGRRPGEKR